MTTYPRDPEAMAALGCAIADTVDEWETPVPLDAGTPPPFPLHALPPVLADYVGAVAAFFEVPADLPGVLALASVAAAVQRKTRLELRPGYSEPLNIYSAIAMPPGSRKSAVFAEVTAPLVDYECELCGRMGPEIAELQSRARVRKKELDDAEAKAAKGGPDAPKWGNARRDLARIVRDTVVPAEPRVLVSDVTPEAVAAGLAEQSGRLAVFSPEGDAFSLLRRYTKDGAPNFEVYLKAHAGDEIRVDRKHAPPVTVQQPALTVALTVQPDVLAGLARDRTLRERGLLARFAFVVPATTVGNRTFDGPPVPNAMRQRYADDVLWLCRWPAQTEPLRLRPDAHDVWHSYALEVERERAPGGMFCALLDWSGKLPGLVGRIVGGLHALQGADRQRVLPAADAATMESGVQLGRYLAMHALAAFDMMGSDPARASAETILDWLKRAPTVAEFSTRDTYRHNRSLEPAAAKLGLAMLAELGWVRQAVDAQRAGRPSERWVVCPREFWPEGMA